MPLIQSCVGTLSYPHLFKPRPKAEGSTELVYSAVMLLSDQQMKSPAYKAMMTAFEDFARKAFPKLILGKGLVTPFRSTAEKENFPPEYKVFFNAQAKLEAKPGIVDAARNPILDSNDVWPGQLVRFSLNPFAWEHSGRKGCSLGLQHVQVVKSEGLKRLDGRKPAEESFDAEFDDANADADEEV